MAIEADIQSVKTVLSLATDGHVPSAGNLSDLKTAAAAPKSRLECPASQREHVVAELADDGATQHKDILPSELREMIAQISHTQLVDTLDVAYTVMRESFEKQLATLKSSLEMEPSQKSGVVAETLETSEYTATTCFLEYSGTDEVPHRPVATPFGMSLLPHTKASAIQHTTGDNSPLDCMEPFEHI